MHIYLHCQYNFTLLRKNIRNHVTGNILFPMFFFSASWSFELADLDCTCLSGVIIVEIDAGDDGGTFTTLDESNPL